MPDLNIAPGAVPAETHTIAQTAGVSVPEAPHRKWENVGDSAADTVGKFVNQTGETSRFINERGVGSVIVAFFLVTVLVLIGIGFTVYWVGRSDTKEAAKLLLDNHKEEITKLIERDRERANDMQERHKNLVSAFKESQAGIHEAATATRDLIKEVKVGQDRADANMKTNADLLRKIIDKQP